MTRSVLHLFVILSIKIIFRRFIRTNLLAVNHIANLITFFGFILILFQQTAIS